MKIYFERSGGFVGRELSTFVNTEAIPPEKALRLLEIVEDVDFFTLPEWNNGSLESVLGGDQMKYKVTVEVAGVQHTVEASDTSAPPRLQPLLSELSRWAHQPEQPDLSGQTF